MRLDICNGMFTRIINTLSIH